MTEIRLIWAFTLLRIARLQIRYDFKRVAFHAIQHAGRFRQHPHVCDLVMFAANRLYFGRRLHL